IQITQILKQYTTDVKNAYDDAQLLVVTVEGLAQSVNQLIEFLNKNPSGEIHQSSVLRVVLAICESKVKVLHSKLMEVYVTRKLKDRLLWPFEKKDHLATIDLLQHCTQTFSF